MSRAIQEAYRWLDIARADLARGDRADAMDSIRMAAKRIRSTYPALTRKAEVLQVLRAGGHVVNIPGIPRLYGPDGFEMPAWVAACRSAASAYEKERKQ